MPFSGAVGPLAARFASPLNAEAAFGSRQKSSSGFRLEGGAGQSKAESTVSSQSLLKISASTALVTASKSSTAAPSATLKGKQIIDELLFPQTGLQIPASTPPSSTYVYELMQVSNVKDRDHPLHLHQFCPLLLALLLTLSERYDHNDDNVEEREEEMVARFNTSLMDHV